MKKLIVTMFVTMLGIIAFPVGSVSATDGVGGDGGLGSDGGSNSTTRPGDKFSVIDLDSGERFECTVTMTSSQVWIIECVSTNNDVFIVRVYVNNGVLVHEVTVSVVSSSGATVEGLTNRAIGLSNSIKNKSPFGQTNYNTKLVSSNALYQVALGQTSPAAHSVANAERQTCFSYLPNDPGCEGGYTNYQSALNVYYAYVHIASFGFQTGVPYPPYAASFFPSYQPAPANETAPSSGC